MGFMFDPIRTFLGIWGTPSPNKYALRWHILFPQGLTSRDTPSPVDPDTVEVLMTFEPDPADLALSSIPGHETFDPRRHRFSEEELKPQPIMKKARKIQVPEEQKVSVAGCGTQACACWPHSPGWPSLHSQTWVSHRD